MTWDTVNEVSNQLFGLDFTLLDEQEQDQVIDVINKEDE